MDSPDDPATDGIYALDWSSLAQGSTPEDPHLYGASCGDTPPSPATQAPIDVSVLDTQMRPLWKGDAFVPVGLHNDGVKCYRNGILQALMACDQFCDHETCHVIPKHVL